MRFRKPATRQATCRFFDKRTSDAKASHRTSNPASEETKSRESVMNNLVGCRGLESLCRQRAVFDRAQSWKWLGDADRWNDLGHRKIASRFQKHSMHAGPIAMGPNALDGNSYRQNHEPMQRLQSAAAERPLVRHATVKSNSSLRVRPAPCHYVGWTAGCDCPI